MLDHVGDNLAAVGTGSVDAAVFALVLNEEAAKEEALSAVGAAEHRGDVGRRVANWVNRWRVDGDHLGRG